MFLKITLTIMWQMDWARVKARRPMSRPLEPSRWKNMRLRSGLIAMGMEISEPIHDIEEV